MKPYTRAIIMECPPRLRLGLLRWLIGYNSRTYVWHPACARSRVAIHSLLSVGTQAPGDRLRSSLGPRLVRIAEFAYFSEVLRTYSAVARDSGPTRIIEFDATKTVHESIRAHPFLPDFVSGEREKSGWDACVFLHWWEINIYQLPLSSGSLSLHASLARASAFRYNLFLPEI